MMQNVSGEGSQTELAGIWLDFGWLERNCFQHLALSLCSPYT